MRLWLDRVLSDEALATGDLDTRLRIAVATVSIVAISLAALALGTQEAVSQSSLRSGLPALGLGLLGIVLILHYLVSGKPVWLLGGFTLAVAGVEIFNLVTGGLTWAGPVWAVLFPTVMFYIYGIRRGLWIVVGYNLAALVILFFPGNALLTAEYTLGFKVHLLLALVSISVMSLVLEFSRATAIKQRDIAIARLDRMAHADSLTGLPNRRAMDERLRVEFERLRRHRQPLCVALIDIDYFKEVNDAYGHDAGDEVLRQCAALMRSHLRGADLLGRWGGEEFLAVMPSTDLSNAVEALDRCREAVAGKPFSYRGQHISITVSIGVARSGPGDTIGQVLVAADDSLFVAKSRGRNSVVAGASRVPPRRTSNDPAPAAGSDRAQA